MTKNDLKSYVTISVLTVIFAICSLLPLGLVGMLFFAALIGLTGYTVTRHHYIFVGFTCVCILLAYMIASQSISAAIYTSAEIIMCGLSLGICFNLKLSASKTVGVVSAIFAMYSIVSIKLNGLSDNFISSISEQCQTLYPLYEGYITRADFNLIITEVVALMTKFMPSFIIIIALLAGLIYFGLFRLILKITKKETFYCKFSQCVADKTISIVYFVLSFVSFILPQNNYYSDVLNNVILISSFTFFIFGLAFILYLIKLKIKSPVSQKIFFALAIVSPLFAFGLPFMVIAFLGALNGIFDIKSKVKPDRS